MLPLEHAWLHRPVSTDRRLNWLTMPVKPRAMELHEPFLHVLSDVGRVLVMRHRCPQVDEGVRATLVPPAQRLTRKLALPLLKALDVKRHH